MTLAKRIAAALAVVIFSAGSALAATVSMQTTMTIESIVGSGANGAGLAVGDEIVFEIIVDNGGGLASNTWGQTDIMSATATSGAYVATFSAPFRTQGTAFATDASGMVTTVNWGDVGLGNTDTLGAGSPKAFKTGFEPSDETVYVYTALFNDASNWTATVVAAVPLPAGLPLLLAGLGGLALLRRKAS